jgi:hypothetical protein
VLLCCCAVPTLRTPIRPDAQTPRRPHTHSHTLTHTHTRSRRSYTHAHTQTLIHKRSYTHAHTHTLTRSHDPHTRSHAHTTHTHTHTHTHTMADFSNTVLAAADARTLSYVDRYIDPARAFTLTSTDAVDCGVMPGFRCKHVGKVSEGGVRGRT